MSTRARRALVAILVLIALFLLITLGRWQCTPERIVAEPLALPPIQAYADFSPAQPVAVPEPATYGLLGAAGLIALVIRSRKR